MVGVSRNPTAEWLARESAWMEFSETTGIAVAEHAAESGRIATFLLVPVVLDLDQLLAQPFANLEEMP
jgi:hypothetical protein